MIKIGVVFSGGGAKGAFQIGVWKAFKEYGIIPYIVAVSGTSIGALNAFLCTQYENEEVISAWSAFTRTSFAPIRKKEWWQAIQRRSLCSKRELCSLIEMIVNNKPFCSDTPELFVTCTNLRYGYPKREVFRLHENRREIANIISASCSIPVVFSHHKIENKGIYFDGGITARTPIEPFRQYDLDYIIVVHNDSLGRMRPLRYRKKNVISIFPSRFQGGLWTGTYGFTKKRITAFIEKGYHDARKVLEREFPLMELEGDRK